MRTEYATERIESAHLTARRLTARSPVRLHMLVILVAVVASGPVASRLLLEAGVTHAGARFPLSVAASYAVFVLLVRIWLWYVSQMRSGTHVEPELAELLAALPGAAGRELFAAPPSAPPGDARGAGDEVVAGTIGNDADEALAVLLFGAVLAALLGAGALLVYKSPLLGAEASLQAWLAWAIARRSRGSGAYGWAASLFADTRGPLAAALALAAAAGLALALLWPSAAGLADLAR